MPCGAGRHAAAVTAAADAAGTDAAGVAGGGREMSGAGREDRDTRLAAAHE